MRNAFDNSTLTSWSVFSTSPWIQFKFRSDGSVKHAVQQYAITSNNVDHHPNADAKNWTLYATNVANATFPGDYVALDSRSEIFFSSRREKQTFSISNNNTPYSAYRLQITANNGWGATIIGEIELFAPASSSSTVANINSDGEQLRLNKNNESETITVFPNPVRDGWLTVSLTAANANKPVDVTVSDLSGKIVYKNNFISNGVGQRLNLSGVQPGVYVIPVTGSNTYNKKIIVE